MVNNVIIDGLIPALNDVIDELILIENKPTIEINKDGVTPSETADTLTQGDVTYSIGGSSSTEVIMGDLDRVYGTSTDNYIGTFNQWDSIDSNKHFKDYDEIILIGVMQSEVLTGTFRRFEDRTNVNILKHYDKLFKDYFPEGNSSNYIKYALDYTNDKFYLYNFNYLCPIALLGIKY